MITSFYRIFLWFLSCDFMIWGLGFPWYSWYICTFHHASHCLKFHFLAVDIISLDKFSEDTPHQRWRQIIFVVNACPRGSTNRFEIHKNLFFPFNMIWKQKLLDQGAIHNVKCNCCGIILMEIFKLRGICLSYLKLQLFFRWLFFVY